jgi:hypothetical protein
MCKNNLLITYEIKRMRLQPLVGFSNSRLRRGRECRDKANMLTSSAVREKIFANIIPLRSTIEKNGGKRIKVCGAELSDSTYT